LRLTRTDTRFISLDPVACTLFVCCLAFAAQTAFPSLSAALLAIQTEIKKAWGQACAVHVQISIKLPTSDGRFKWGLRRRWWRGICRRWRRGSRGGRCLRLWCIVLAILLARLPIFLVCGKAVVAGRGPIEASVHAVQRCLQAIAVTGLERPFDPTRTCSVAPLEAALDLLVAFEKTPLPEEPRVLSIPHPPCCPPAVFNALITLIHTISIAFLRGTLTILRLDSGQDKRPDHNENSQNVDVHIALVEWMMFGCSG
ncbi:uncharacterized protein BO95DRAFT_494988, partial [Aspergillus brunneoviolaceus CBS 621.78]